MWLKKRRKVIGSHQSHNDNDVDALEHSSSSLSTVKMNDQYRSSTSLKNLVGNDEVATEVEADDSQSRPQSYHTSDTDDALDESLSTVEMNELSLTSRHLIHEALEYARYMNTNSVQQKGGSGYRIET